MAQKSKFITFKILLVSLFFTVSHLALFTTPVLAQATNEEDANQAEEQEQTNYTEKEPGFRDKNFMSSNKIEFFDPNCAEGSSSGGSSGSTTDGGGCGVDEDDNQENKDQIWSFFVTEFKADGASNDQAEIMAAGIMGNMTIETGGTYNPHIAHGMGCNDSPAMGLVQWCFERKSELIAFAAEKGVEWQCLGAQLEFIFFELTTKFEEAYELMKEAETAGRAANIFDDGGDGPLTGVSGFEESIPGDNQKRFDAANERYEEFTGKSASSLGSSGSQDCKKDSTSSGGIMDADCEALVARYQELRKDKNRLVETVPEAIDDDLSKCSEGVHQCNEGINPYLLRAVVAIIENSGDEATEIWNMNNRHPCDGLNHPKGMASDIFCFDNAHQGTSGYSAINGGKGPSKEKCNRIFKFLYDNYEELKLVELIWNAPTDFSHPGDGKQLSVAGHHDHIHIGVNPDVGGQNK